jgi:hypothetical protein
VSPFGIVAGVVACWALSGAALAQAQEEPTPAQGPPSLQELAKTHKNPFVQSVNVPFQFITGFGVGSERRTGESLNIQPQLPFSLTSGWSLVAMPSISVTYVPPPDEEFGLQGLQLSLFLTARTDRWIWGVGPIVQFPTASATGLGTGKWSAGPTVGVAYSNGPWFNGVLASHLWSFAGDPARDAVSLTSFEVLVSYNFHSGWYVQFDPVYSYDWTADARNAWTVPVGLDVGKVFSFAQRSISLQLGAYKLLERPDGAPDWIVRAQIQFSFPTGQ